MNDNDSKVEDLNEVPPEEEPTSEVDTNALDTDTVEANTSDGLSPIEKELKKTKEELLYLRADFDNYRKRMFREQEQKIKFANERFVHELLTVYNNFELALTHGKKVTDAHPDAESFYKGIEMNYHELGQMLGRFGVEFHGNIGESFDPNKHEALAQIPGPADSEGKLVQVIRKGCSLNGRLITPAQVAVGTLADKGNEDG